MTAKKGKGLGKGIDAMIPSIDNMPKGRMKKPLENEKGETYLNINEVEPNREQPRKNFNEDALQELSESIKQHGIIQPIVVTKKDDYYQIIAGERRWRAAKLAKLKEVPVIIKDYTPEEVMEIALIENIQREDLNPVEEALAYQNLIEEYKLKQDEVAERVSKSRTAITNSLRLLKLDKRILDMLVDEQISSGHARALLAIPEKEEQYNIAMKIFDERLSVRETEKLVKSMSKPKKAKVKEKLENEFIYRDLENQLREIIGTKVTINPKTNKKGKIEIEYYSQEELEKIIEYFKG